jgi:dTDP-4-dehydrorhamnose 3,5-epimerase
MKIKNTKITDVFIVETQVYEDKRGSFYESFSLKNWMEQTGLTIRFVQDNVSHSTRNVIRGLHYQKEPFEQGKLIRCIKGVIWDVAVDIRSTSLTYGKYIATVLSDHNHNMLWIPTGFAHGFLTLSEEAIVLYKTTEYYNPSKEGVIRWDDPIINIKWPLTLDVKPILSDKDLQGRLFAY